MFFHRQGEIRDRTSENQSYRASGLSLITAAIVHWNTVYLDLAVRQSRDQGATIPENLLAHVAPLGWEHIGLAGDYVWTASDRDTPFRPLRDVRARSRPWRPSVQFLNRSAGDPLQASHRIGRASLRHGCTPLVKPVCGIPVPVRSSADLSIAAI